jgi:hypothetical protein
VLAGAFIGLELRLTGTSDCCYFRYISSVLKPEFVSLVLPKNICQKMSKPGFCLHFQYAEWTRPLDLCRLRVRTSRKHQAARSCHRERKAPEAGTLVGSLGKEEGLLIYGSNGWGRRLAGGPAAPCYDGPLSGKRASRNSVRWARIEHRPKVAETHCPEILLTAYYLKFVTRPDIFLKCFP